MTVFAKFSGEIVIYPSLFGDGLWKNTVVQGCIVKHKTPSARVSTLKVKERVSGAESERGR